MKLIEDRKQFTKELKIIKKEVASFDISRYEPTQKVLDKIEDYKNRNSRVNVKAITTADKLLTYYYAAAILGYDSLKSDIRWELAVSRFTRPYRGSEVWRSVFPELRLRIDMSDFNELNDYKEHGGRGPDQEFIYGILDKIETAAKQARKIDENQKVTLTIGQLKKLVTESGIQRSNLPKFPEIDYEEFMNLFEHPEYDEDPRISWTEKFINPSRFNAFCTNAAFLELKDGWIVVSNQDTWLLVDSKNLPRTEDDEFEVIQIRPNEYENNEGEIALRKLFRKLSVRRFLELAHILMDHDLELP